MSAAGEDPVARVSCENAPGPGAFSSGDFSDRLLDAIPAAVYVCDPAGLIVRYNRRAAELWGRSPQIRDPNEKFCGALHLFWPDGRPLPYDLTPMARALATGEPAHDVEVIIERPDGSRSVVLANVEPLRDKAGRIIGAVNCFTDITARKHAQEAANRSQEELEDFFENAPIAVHWESSDGTILRANRAELALLGYSADEYVGRNVRQFHTDQVAIDALLRRLSQGEHVINHETQLRAKDGSVRDVLISSNVSSRDGQFLHARCFTVDVTERKRLETRLALAKDAGGVGTFDRDLVRGTIYVSDSYWKLFGVERQEFMPSYEAWLSRVHPDDRAAVLRALDRATEQGRYEAEYRVVWPNGEIHWLQARGRAYVGPDGRPYRLVGALVDISVRKRAEEELRHREAELRLVTDSVPALIGYVASDLRYGFVNRGYEMWLGKPREQIEGRHMAEVLGAIYDTARPHVDKALAGELVHFESLVPRIDGERHVEGSYLPRRGSDGRVVGFYTFVHDVTERKRAEAALRARTTELETVMETVPAAVWITNDSDASVIIGSRYASQLFRMEAGQNLSRTPPDGKGPRHWWYAKNGIELPLDESPLRLAARGQPVYGEELELVFDDGSRRPLLLNATPIFDADGRPIGAVAAGMDITDQKLNEERLKLVAAELDHRVRNTLGTIRSMLRLAGRSAETKEDLTRAISGRIDAMARAHGLLTRTGWRGASLLRLMSDELAPFAAADKPQMHFEGPDLLLRPSAAISVALVVHELATNSLKYGALSAVEGEVRLSWRTETPPDEHLVIEWNERGGPSVRTPTRHGFGSEILKGALRHEFGADVRIGYDPEGLRFFARVPLQRIAAPGNGGRKVADVPPASASQVPAERNLTGARVLVVEDELLIALDIQDRLEAIGIEALGPAGRLDEALAIAKTQKPDAALLDVSIGDARVFPVADLLAERGVPFAFLTGYDTQSMLPERFRDVPAVQKPFSGVTITNVVRQLISGTAPESLDKS